MDRAAAEKVLKEAQFKPGESTHGHPSRVEIKAALRAIAAAPPKKMKETDDG